MTQTQTIKWNRSENGFVTSKCGRFSVDPLFMGCETAQAYEVFDCSPTGKRIARFLNTQREAKQAAQDFLDHENSK